MIDLKRYKQLKEQVENAQQKADRAEGAFNTTMETLQKKFGCSTIKAGERKLEKMEEEEKKLQIKMNKAIEDFEEVWR